MWLRSAVRAHRIAAAGPYRLSRQLPQSLSHEGLHPGRCLSRAHRPHAVREVGDFRRCHSRALSSETPPAACPIPEKQLTERSAHRFAKEDSRWSHQGQCQIWLVYSRLVSVLKGGVQFSTWGVRLGAGGHFGGTVLRPCPPPPTPFLQCWTSPRALASWFFLLSAPSCFNIVTGGGGWRRKQKVCSQFWRGL